MDTLPMNPPDPATELRRRITTEAIRAWHAARDLRDDAAILAVDDPTLARWEALMDATAEEAERCLLGAILARDESIPPDQIVDACYEAHRQQAVEHEGRTYLAVSNPELSPGEDAGGEQCVRLVVVEPGGIAAA